MNEYLKWKHIFAEASVDEVGSKKMEVRSFVVPVSTGA